MGRAMRWVGLGVLIAFTASGCWSSVRKHPVPGKWPQSRIRSAVLKVNANAVPWGSHQMGSVVRDQLLSSGAFDQIHYPIQPEEPPPLRIEIVSHGSVDEHVVWGVFGSILVGASLFTLSPVVPFFESFDLVSDVTFFEGGARVARTRIEVGSRVTHAIFADATAYQEEASARAFRTLANGIVEELAKHARLP